MSSDKRSLHLLETWEARASTFASSMKDKTYSRLALIHAMQYNICVVPTLKQSSSGKQVNGSFFNNGLTKFDTKLSCWLVQRLSKSPKILVLAGPELFLKYVLICARNKSSWSFAVLQSGLISSGPGLAAGVGGGGGSWLIVVGESSSAGVVRFGVGGPLGLETLSSPGRSMLPIV